MSSFQAPSFTPVRRKEDTLNLGRIQGEQEQEWTAARCHRLLRALTSRVAILNKEISKYSTTTKTCDKASSKAYFPLSETRTPDDDWAQPRRKKLKLTYGGRRRGGGNKTQRSLSCREGFGENQQSCLVPGEVTVPTPLLVRARGTFADLQIPQESPSNPGICALRRTGQHVRSGSVADSSNSTWQLTTSLQNIRRTTDSVRFAAYEGIHSSLESLIRNTDMDESNNRRAGARTLFSMALRRIPDYISEQDFLLQTHVKDTNSKSAIVSRDMSTEIYDELESFGTSGKHWKHLRTVVRSHGIQIVSSAITDGLISNSVSGALVSMLVARHCHEEAELVLDAMVNNKRYTNPKTPSDTADERLVMLNKYAQHTKRFGFRYRQLTTILENGILPRSWLATKAFSQIWTALIQHISANYVDSKLACKFLEVALPSLASATQIPSGQNHSSANGIAFADAARNTFMSLLTTISGMFILSDEARRSDVFKTLPHTGYERILSVLKSSTITMNLSNSADPMMAPLLLSRLVIEVRGDELKHNPHILDLTEIERHLRMTNVLRESATFISNLARCCGKGSFTSGFEYLQQFHQSLESHPSSEHDSSLLKFILVDSAYEFAHQNMDRQHLDYASQLDLRLASRTNVVKHVQDGNSCDKEQRGGFRWEDGIGEWVAATPAIKLVKQFTLRDFKVKDDTECETPYRPRTRKQSPVHTPSMPITNTTTIAIEIPVPARDLLYALDVGPAASGSHEANFGVHILSDEETESNSSDRASSCRYSLRQRPDQCRSGQEHDDSAANVETTLSLSQASRSSSNTAGHADEESDDELSFVSVSTPTNERSRRERVLREISRNRTLRPRPPKGKEGASGVKLRKRRLVDLMSDSEDELCLLC